MKEKINEARIAEGKRPFGSIIHQEVVEGKISVADPESGYYVKTEQEKQFAYSAHTVCDENGFVLDVMITPGNLHDSRMLVPQIERVKSCCGVAADAAYKTPWNAKYLIDRKLRPIFPYTRPKRSKERFKRKIFIMIPIITGTYAQMIKHFSFAQLLEMVIKNMYLNLLFVKVVYY